ncbi:beta-glucosidase BglX [bacterium]|nr:beta-glucosidase BglX [bacterium]
MLIQRTVVSAGFLLILSAGLCIAKPIENEMNQKIDDLLSQMTLEEKVGQLHQIGGSFATGPDFKNDANREALVRNGWIGSFLNIVDLGYMRELQRLAVEESRMKIPLMFALDVVHGYKTIFPVPLAQAASWDPDLIEKAERVAATEAAASGIHWTFAPMVDIARDPRWGRVMEGSGEDPCLGSRIAEARVRGFQGEDLSAENTILACAKHFAAYGAAEGGRDYNTVDLSELVLREVYLPPFQAVVDAGVASVMNSFNVVFRMPASANALLMNQILKGEWNFQGFVISDWNSYGEMIAHGVAADKYDVACLAMNAGSDVDMQGYVYIDALIPAVKDGKVAEERLNDAVRRFMKMKFKLGLFDDPYGYINPERMKNTLMIKPFQETALKLAHESIVLLKNENHLLPVQKKIGSIAVIGQLADSREFRDMLGNWCAMGDMNDVVTILQGVKKKVSRHTKILYAKGCEAFGQCPDSLIQEAVIAAEESDVVLLALGENGFMSGEATSRAYIGLPGDQIKLAKAVHATGKPIVLLLMTGRPLTIPWCHENIPAIVNIWQAGTMGGQAAADVVFGDVNPSGKLPVTFPLTIGQVPLYYNALNTGRPVGPDGNPHFRSAYIDCPNDPLYPFGFGLSYTAFEYSDLILSSVKIGMNDVLTVRVNVRNTGKRDGIEVVQLYIRDLVGSVSRPLKELKGFERVPLKAGESRQVEFHLTSDALAFWSRSMTFEAEPGDFKVFVGGSSADVLEENFTLE